MFEMDHVAIQTADIPTAVQFYRDNFGATVLYQDASWAFLKIGQGKLALVLPQQHPPHVALRVSMQDLHTMAERCGRTIATHRDGTQGIYLTDPAGNVTELIYYPPGYVAQAKDA
ncbi:MAG: VOC family protein [Phycisphaerae bacterium]|nr:VOC family protein [Phycisphaerae bacterium]